jgi:hypothetical protein
MNNRYFRRLAFRSDNREDSMIIRGDDKFPYVVVRLMATVYQRHRIVFSSCSEVDEKKVFHVIWHQRIDRSKPIPPSALDELIAAVKKASRSSGFRMCIVLSENDALYVEPCGQIVRKSDPPSGGISL